MNLLSIISISCFFVILFCLIIISIAANIKGEVCKKFTSQNLFFPRITKTHGFLKISFYIKFPTPLGNFHNVSHNITQKALIISFCIFFDAYFLRTIYGVIMFNKIPTELFKESDDNKYFTGSLT